MPRTGAFVSNPEALYAEEPDPLTLDAWGATTTRPLILNGDTRHFYQASDQVFGLQTHPLTRAKLDDDSFQPLLHPHTELADYLALLRALRAHGWNHPEVVAADLHTLHRHALGEHRLPPPAAGLLAQRLLSSHDVDAFAAHLWNASVPLHVDPRSITLEDYRWYIRSRDTPALVANELRAMCQREHAAAALGLHLPPSAPDSLVRRILPLSPPELETFAQNVWHASRELQMYPSTPFATYLEGLRIRRANRYTNLKTVTKDLRDLYLHEQGAAALGLPREPLESDSLVRRLLHLRLDQIDAFAQALWEAAVDPRRHTALMYGDNLHDTAPLCPLLETDKPWLGRVEPTQRGVCLSNGTGRPPSPFVVTFRRNGVPVCRCRMPGAPDGFVEYFDTHVREAGNLRFRNNLLVRHCAASHELFSVDTHRTYIEGYAPRQSGGPFHTVNMLGRDYGSFLLNEEWEVLIVRSPPS